MATVRGGDSRSLDAVRSPSDHKQYRLVHLANGLEALLIHCDPPEAPRAAAGGAHPGQDEPDAECEPQSPRALRRSIVSHTAGYDTDSGSDDDDDDDGGNADDTNSEHNSTDDSDGEHEDHHGHRQRTRGGGSRHAAACLTVGVGSMADPPNVRGLAHFLEHMLFMGSAKYPDENAFEAFLSTHGGYSNGATECESTRYLFETDPHHFREALDMFAQFFVSPLFKSEAMDRELRAIESEFNRARQNDYVRLQQVQCETSAPGSAYDSFSWGNWRSLREIPAECGLDVREEMLQFFARHYVAHRMKLCVLAEDSLDDLEVWVREYFGAIPTRRNWGDDLAPATTTEIASPPFGVAAGQPATLIRVVPVRKTHTLHLYWPMPNLLGQYRQKPWEYLSHALGHEGPGSLSAILKDRMWATEVSVGITEADAYEFGSFGSLFEVNASLTRLGLERWDDVIAVVFDVVRFIRDDGLKPWIFHELRAASEMNFRFQEEGDPLTLCRRLADLMQPSRQVDRDDLLSYEVLRGPFDPSPTEALFAYLTPDNSRILLLSHTFADEATASSSAAFVDSNGWQTERWLAVQYKQEPIEAMILRKWSLPFTDDVQLTHPEPNPFMPDEFSILPLPIDGALEPNAEPKLVHSTAMSKLWFKRDVKFLVPRTNAYFLLCLPSLTASVSNYIHAKIYLRAVHEALQHVQYQAYLANLSYDLGVRDLDIEVTFSGFSSKIPELVSAVFDAILHTEIDDATFTLIRDEMLKEYRNLNLKPSVKARYMRLQLLEQRTFSVEDKLGVLASTQAEDVRGFKHFIMWQCEATLRSMIHGNIGQDQAIAMLEAVEQAIDEHTIRLPPMSPIRPQTTALPFTANGLLLRAESDHDEETNSIVENYYQLGRETYEDLAYAELLQQVMAEPLFHDLRTTQQLGYEVFCMVRETHGVLGFSISVQSASHPAGELALCIDKFVEVDFWKHVQGLTMATLHKHVVSLTRMKTREDSTLYEESDRYWEEIQSRRLEFLIDDRVVEALATCTVEGLRDRYQRWLLRAVDDGACRAAAAPGNDHSQLVRKLRVHVIGRRSQFVPLETLVAEDETPHIIDDLLAYKAALECHHPPGSHEVPPPPSYLRHHHHLHHQHHQQHLVRLHPHHHPHRHHHH